MNDVTRYDRSRLGRAQRTSLGGARVPARVARTGVLTYRNPDGSVRRELRLPEEVFHPDSLATLDGVPVIDISDHTGMVTPSTFRKVALGHAGCVRQDGDSFVAAELNISDGAALAKIDAGERADVSAGYTCKLDMTPGVWKGEAYDCVQREIRYNHVALCPPNGGRSGPEVGLRLDAGGAVSNVDGPTRRGFPLDGMIDTVARRVPIVASTDGAVDGESLESWDLTRFMANPIILFAHRDDDLPVAKASDIRTTSRGLEMVANFPPAGEYARADDVFRAITSARLRGVSVGFEPGPAREEQRDGKPVVVRSANKLLEVSFVPVPADANAGTLPSLETDEQRAARLAAHASAAGRDLQSHRKPAPSEPNDEADETRTRMLIGGKTPTGPDTYDRENKEKRMKRENHDGLTEAERVQLDVESRRSPESVAARAAFRRQHGAIAPPGTPGGLDGVPLQGATELDRSAAQREEKRANEWRRTLAHGAPKQVDEHFDADAEVQHRRDAWRRTLNGSGDGGNEAA